jgi:tetratricopeptide (TPR) repeat protein
MVRLRKTKSLILLLLCVCPQGSALASDYLQQGKRYYAAGQLDKAGRYFQAEVASEPNSATAHYFLGNVFVGLKRLPEAIKEYRAASELDRNGQVGQYSRQALATLESPATRNEQKNAEDSNQRSDAELTRNSAAAISRETNERSERNSAECDAKVRTVMQDSERRVKTLEQEMNDRIAQNGSALYVTAITRGGRTSTDKSYDPEADNKLIRAEYAPKIEAIKAEARKHADEIIASYRQKSAALEDSAISIDKAYLKPGKDIKLSPLRTDIYVRSYETGEEPSGDTVPVKASPAKALPKTAPAKKAP